MIILTTVVALALNAGVAKPRKPTSDELAAAAKALKLEVDDLDLDQSFEVDALGPHTVVLSLGCAAVAVVRGEQVLVESRPDSHCRAALDAMTFKDVDGDGRVDVVILSHDPNTNLVTKNPFGIVLLQQADRSIVEATTPIDLGGKQKATLKDVEKAFKRGLANAGPRKQ